MRQQQSLHSGCGEEAELVPCHHQRRGDGAGPFRDALHEQRGGGRPFAAEADAEQKLDDHQRGIAPRQPREAGEDGEPDHAEHKGELAAIAVGQPAPADIAGDASDALGGDDETHGGEPDAEMLADLRQDQQKRDLIERVEKPAEKRRDHEPSVRLQQGERSVERLLGLRRR